MHTRVYSCACRVCVTVGKTDPSADIFHQQSMIIVPMDSAGVRVVRHLSVFGYDDAPYGHGEVGNTSVPWYLTPPMFSQIHAPLGAQHRLT